MKEIFEKCEWCNKPIRYGNAMVTVNRNIEQIDRDDENPNGVVTVIQSDVVLTLCADCGNGLDIGVLGKMLSPPTSASS